MDEGSTDSKIDDLLKFVSSLVQRQREEVRYMSMPRPLSSNSSRFVSFVPRKMSYLTSKIVRKFKRVWQMVSATKRVKRWKF